MRGDFTRRCFRLVEVALMDLDREVRVGEQGGERHQPLEDRLGAGAWDHYRPGAWVPHCTLASDLEPQQFGSALAIAGRTSLPFECRLVEVGIVEFRPVKQLVSRVLGGCRRAGV